MMYNRMVDVQVGQVGSPKFGVEADHNSTTNIN